MHKYSQILTSQTRHHRSCLTKPLLWFLCCILLFAQGALAQTTQEPAQLRAMSLGWDIPLQRLDDPTGLLTVDDVHTQQGAGIRWHTMEHNLNAGYNSPVVWLRFKVPQTTSGNEPAWLLGDPPFLDSVVLYQEDEATGVWLAQRSGDHVPARFKPALRQHLFKLETGKWALLRIQTTSDLAPVFPDPSYSQRNAASLTGERRAWAA